MDYVHIYVISRSNFAVLGIEIGIEALKTLTMDAANHNISSQTFSMKLTGYDKLTNFLLPRIIAFNLFGLKYFVFSQVYLATDCMGSPHWTEHSCHCPNAGATFSMAKFFRPSHGKKPIFYN